MVVARMNRHEIVHSVKIIDSKGYYSLIAFTHQYEIIGWRNHIDFGTLEDMGCSIIGRKVLNLDDWPDGQGADFTSPLAIEMGEEHATDPEGEVMWERQISFNR